MDRCGGGGRYVFSARERPDEAGGADEAWGEGDELLGTPLRARLHSSHKLLARRKIGWAWIDMNGYILYMDPVMLKVIDAPDVGTGGGCRLYDLLRPREKKAAFRRALHEMVERGDPHVSDLDYACMTRHGAEKRLRIDINIVYHPAGLEPTFHVFCRERKDAEA
jgi:hypothetical protein